MMQHDVSQINNKAYVYNIFNLCSLIFLEIVKRWEMEFNCAIGRDFAMLASKYDLFELMKEGYIPLKCEKLKIKIAIGIKKEKLVIREEFEFICDENLEFDSVEFHKFLIEIEKRLMRILTNDAA